MKNRTKYVWLKRLVLAALSISAMPVVAQAAGAEYPVACLDEVRALGVGIATPISSGLIMLPVMDLGFGDGRRPAIIAVSRHACGGSRSVVLIAVDDYATWSGYPPPSMLYPDLRATQGGHVATLSAIALRTGHRIAAYNVGEIGISGLNTSFAALEVLNGEVDLNRPFDLSVTDPLDSANERTIAVPGFEPTPVSYPAAYGPRVISGRYAGNYYDPERSGEGIIVEIGDVPGRASSHFLQYSWFTYDKLGNPFWISGGGDFTDGSKHLHMPAAVRSGGGFAGAQAATTLSIWGSVDMEFSDCTTLQLGFSGGGPSFAPNVPSGSGQLKWKRLTGISGYSCD